MVILLVFFNIYSFIHVTIYVSLEPIQRLVSVLELSSKSDNTY